MLTGVRIFTTDSVWRQILADLNADVDVDAKTADVNFDDVIPNISTPISLRELVILITDAMDNTGIISRLLGNGVHLSRLPAQIITLLYKSGGMSGAQLKAALGYAPNAATHTVDTAIYTLRRTYGRDFIKNENGVYKLGGI